MFSGVNVVTLYLPIEVCSNFSAIQDTLDHIDWRNAWTADSRVRESMLSTSRVVSNFPEPAQVVFFSDGEEAPKLHAFNTRDLSTLQNADGWLLVGIGSEKGAAIPKFTEKNQLLGYWSHESIMEGIDTLREKGVRRVGPYMVTKAMASGVSACLATGAKIKGINYGISSACSTSAHCIGCLLYTSSIPKNDRYNVVALH